jgi:GWxTD domain-containing protein
MKIRVLLPAALMASMAVSASALSFEHIDWGNGPAQFLMTKEEVAAWKAIRTDAEADEFIALFWARRDPTPDTPRNEFKEQFAQRVAFADKNLSAAERIRGAMSDRGRILITYGQPKRIERSTPARAPSFDQTTGNLQKDERASDDWVQWIYEGEDIKAVFLVPKATIRFVDRLGNDEYKLERGNIDLVAAQQRAASRTILNPELSEAPKFAAPAAAAPVSAPAAAPMPTVLATPALQTAVTELKAGSKNPYESKAYASWGEYVTSNGQSFVPVLLYVPKSAGISADSSLTFFGVVEDASGNSVAAFEEPARLTATKDDFFVDKSLTLPAGKHRGIFGLAQGATPVVMAMADMDLAGTLDKTATAISPLILSNNIYPLTEAQAPTDPFAFGGVKVVPKSDRTFRPSDELWYFFELRNPGVAEPAPPADGTVPVTPPEAAPKVQVKIDVEGVDLEGKKIRRPAPLREVNPIPMKGVPGHFGVGNAIPLSSFKPGDYTFTLKVIDTVKKESYTLSEKFRVVP